ncbi:MAG: DUF3105 domain-containing protein [Gaiellaceae bacterium]
MAGKRKTPPPPRRVQAPKQRSGGGGRKDPAGGDRRRLLLAIFAASGLAMLIIVVGFLLLAGGDGGGGDDKVASAMRAAGCSFKSVDAKPYRKGQTHVPEGTNVKWNTFPPAAGSHYDSPAIWDFYTEVVDPRRVVHNEEHGGVVLWWGPATPESQVAELRALYDDKPESMIGTPVKGLGERVAITAWTGDPKRYGSEDNYYGHGHVGVCPAYDESAFRTFRDEYRGKGPEGIPPEVNQPGQ